MPTRTESWTSSAGTSSAVPSRRGRASPRSGTWAPPHERLARRFDAHPPGREVALPSQRAYAPLPKPIAMRSVRPHSGRLDFFHGLRLVDARAPARFLTLPLETITFDVMSRFGNWINR